MSKLVDLIVTRRESDPTDYRKIVSMCLDVNLIEAPYVPNDFVTARKNIAKYGTAEYVSWFDPDDKLYAYTLPLLIQTLKENPDAIGALCSSEYLVRGRTYNIVLSEFTTKPVHGHLMRIIKRSWFEENIHLLDAPVPEWPLTAKMIEDGAIYMPFSGFRWNVGETGDHQRITNQEIAATRVIMRSILGAKYQQLVKDYPA